MDQHTLCDRCRLFISWNKGYTQEIRRSSVSRRLVQVISAAYARSGSDLPGVVPRPQEVRTYMGFLPGIRPFQEPPGHHGGCALALASDLHPVLLEGCALRARRRLPWGCICSGGQTSCVPSKKQSRDLKNLKPDIPSFLVALMSHGIVCIIKRKFCSKNYF